MIKPWSTLSSAPAGDFRIFQVRKDIKRSPRTGDDHDFVIIECVNWVNIIATTADGHLVMVEQFRHGSNTVELEIPGGVMDSTDTSPEHTAQRELREETGYSGTQGKIIGQVFSNPAIMNNTCYTVLVHNCQFSSATRFDTGEDLVNRFVPVKDIPELIRSGKIRHSMVVVALYYFELWQRAQSSK